MNYCHDYHAGNFADVFKHVFLTRVLLHLAVKPAAFRYIETHSGAGTYDLAGPEAEKTAEWRKGIGRLAAAELAPEARELIEPYSLIVLPLVSSDASRYPGSPAIARAMLRSQDRMLFCELHPEARRRLEADLGKDARAKVLAIDGYAGLKAFVPPVERRGLVLIDPPFEQADEFARLADAIETAWRKWATGIYMAWYPVKDSRLVDTFTRGLMRRGIERVLRLELQIDAARRDGPLARTGLVLVNPPYRLEAEAEIILPSLCRTLSEGRADFLIEWLNAE